jgi:hypothetical protein
MDSKAFFEVSSEELPFQASRLKCIKDFLKKCFFLPFALVAKIALTFFRFVGVFIGAVCLILPLGGARRLFIDRVSSLAHDLADWVMYPFAIAVRCARLVVALIDPKAYFS